METQKFIDGFYANKPHENAPDFVIANLKWDNGMLQAFIGQQVAKGKQTTQMQIKLSKAGKYYAEIDNYEPKENRPEVVTEAMQAKKDEDAFNALGKVDYPEDEINPDDIPF